jgi:hypothetical protein
MGLDQDMRAAGIALLRTNPNLTVYDEPVPNGAALPYIRVYSTVEWPRGDPDNALNGASRKGTARWYLHCIAGSDAGTIVLAELARTSLLDIRPTIAGLVTSQIGPIQFEQDGGAQPSVDETTGTAYVDAMHVYRMDCNT